MSITQKIKESILKSVNDLGIGCDTSNIILETPNDPSHGDFSTNIAMILAGRNNRKPRELAEEIVKGISEDVDYKNIEIAGPGFINFHLSNVYYLKDMMDIVNKTDKHFKLNTKENKNIVIEYTDPNPFKILHIGHLYTNTVGESFSRLQEALGASVKRANYQGDVGLHVAKTLWGLEKKLTEENITFESIKEKDLIERVKYLGDAYVLGTKYYDTLKDDVAKKQIDDINYFIFSLCVPSLPKKDFSEYESKQMEEKYKVGRQWCLEYFETIYTRMGTHFDYYFFESEIGEDGLKVVLANIGNVFEKDGDAIIYRGDEKKGLHTRVFVNKYGIPTYEAKELGLALKKKELIDFDESIMITGSEQAGYFKVVLDALSKVRPDLSEKMKHIPHGMVKLPGKLKMSSREGSIITAQWLLDETKRLVMDIVKEGSKVRDLNVDDISEKIAVAAIKYAYLRVGVGKDIIFDFDKSISFDGETGPYLLYVYARCNSILKDTKFNSSESLCLDNCLKNIFIEDLVKHVSKFENSLLISGTNYSPSTMCQYLFDLGQKFNAFYQNVRVLDAEGDEKNILLAVVSSTMITMQKGLELLGIQTVEEM